MKKRGCPGCGYDGITQKCIAEHEVCGGCGLPVALWPRMRAAMEITDAILSVPRIELALYHKLRRSPGESEGGREMPDRDRFTEMADRSAAIALGQSGDVAANIIMEFEQHLREEVGRVEAEMDAERLSVETTEHFRRLADARADRAEADRDRYKVLYDTAIAAVGTNMVEWADDTARHLREMLAIKAELSEARKALAKMEQVLEVTLAALECRERSAADEYHDPGYCGEVRCLARAALAQGERKKEADDADES
jgi:hypothetical protein